MKILLLGAAGFIGTNLAIELAKDNNNEITLVDNKIEYFSVIKKHNYKNIIYKEYSLESDSFLEKILEDQDVVYHLVSTNVPTTSNQHITQDIRANVIFSSELFDACVRCGVKKVVFISSGGTVYGKETNCPLKEDTPTNPITSYGVQKITIEKLLYLYNYMYGLDYRIIRLANPYGPYQRPNGVLGAVTTFTYKALNNETINVFGDGTVVRDFIYIDDAVKAIVNIMNGSCDYHTFNVGSGCGTSINEVLKTIKNALNLDLKINYLPGRKVDVPVNFLDVSRYENCFGKLNPVSLHDGVVKTACFLEKYKGQF